MDSFRPHQRTRAEKIVFTVITLCVTGGVGLGLASIILPNWVLTHWIKGIVIMQARVGLWSTNVCDQLACTTYYAVASDYDETLSEVPKEFESIDTVRMVATGGVFSSILALSLLCPLWISPRIKSWHGRTSIQFLFFFTSLVSGIACVVAPLIVTNSVDTEKIDFAPFLSCGASGLLLLVAILSGMTCRFDIPRNKGREEAAKKFALDMNLKSGNGYIVDFVCPGEIKKQPLP